MGMLHFAVPPSVMTDHVLPLLHVYHEISSWPNSWTSDPSWTILLEFGLINNLLLYVTGRRWCRSLAKVTKWVPIEKSKLFFVIHKTVIPYPYNALVSYPLSLKLFCQLSLIPKTPNRASHLPNIGQLETLKHSISLHFGTQSIFFRELLWNDVLNNCRQYQQGSRGETRLSF